MKKNLNLIAGVILGAVFLLIWLKLVDWEKLIWYFRNYNLSMIPLYSGFYLLAYVLRSWRWKIIIEPEYRMTGLYSFGVFMTGMLINYLIPVRAGELAKSIVLKNKNQVPISRSLPSIFIDKLTDLFPIMLIIILIPLLTVKMTGLLLSIILILLAIFLFFLGFLYLTANNQEKAIKVLSFFKHFTPVGWRDKLDRFFSGFVQGMAIMRGRSRDHVMIYLITLGAVFSEALYVYFVFRAFGAESSYPMILFGYTLMNLTYILPTPPAQIGSNQFMWVLIFSIALGIDKNLTGAAVVFSHLLTSIWIFLVGIISLLALKINFRELVYTEKEVQSN